jgi:PKD repeat protein
MPSKYLMAMLSQNEKYVSALSAMRAMRQLGKAILFVLAPLSALGTHIVGSEIYYTCLGNNQYQITLKVYRDCLIGEAPFDSPAYISIYNNSGGLVSNLAAYHNGATQLPVVITNPCLQAPPNICVEEAIYTVSTTLPSVAGGYHVAYQRCCRNGTIVNLTTPGAQGATSYVHIPELALSSCNSSPRFNEFPPLALCAGDPLVFDHSATDPDGDLIVYSLCAPYVGGSQTDPAPSPAAAPPYGLVNWGGAYNAGYPMTSSPALTIDPVTGILTGTPIQQGQFVVGVCAEEYRNGQLISVNKRDFQFNVVSCVSNIVAIIPAIATFHDPCLGRQVTFDNLSINATSYHWDFGVAGIDSDISSQQFPTFLFPDTGTYTVTLVANPEFSCADSTTQQVVIYDPVVAIIPLMDGQCADANAFNFEADGQFGNGASFFWEFENATPPTSTERDPENIIFNSAGQFTVRLTITEAICSDQDETVISTYPRPQAAFDPGPHIGCTPFSVGFQDASYSATGHQLLWEFGNGATSSFPATTQTFADPGTYDVTLTIWTSSGCIDTVQMTVPMDVVVNPLPSGQITVFPDTQSIFNPDFTLTGLSDNAMYCIVIPDANDTLSAPMQGCEFLYTYADTGTYHPMLIVINEFGCTDTSFATLRVRPEFRFWLPNAFRPGGNPRNDTWGPKAMGVKDYRMWVFNRWGQEVFYSEDHRVHWDGRVYNQGNQEVVQGVYAYRVTFRSVEGEPFEYLGSVTLVR